MNDTMSTEVREYVTRVRAALSDLPVADVEEFTTGMEADLAERLAEPGEGTLSDRLGSPEVYAAEPAFRCRPASARGRGRAEEACRRTSLGDVGPSQRPGPRGGAVDQ